MSKLTQREPGAVAIRKGLDALVAGLNERHPGERWRVSSPPDRLVGAGSVGPRRLDDAGVIGPDDENAVLDAGAAGLATNEDDSDHSREQIA